MKNINWSEFYSYNTIADRRKYLEKLFKSYENRRVDELLFNINPVTEESNKGKKYRNLRNLAQKTANAARSTLRHLVLPFPLVWTSKSSDSILSKSVLSVESYIMSTQPMRLKDHISALRTGAPQYRGLLFGAAGSLVSIAVGLSVASFGIAPVIGLGVAAGYFGYTAFRASRKISKQVGYLKSRIASIDKYVPNSKPEKLFNRLYNVVSVLEEAKNDITKRENEDRTPQRNMEILRHTLKEQLSTSLNDDSLSKEFQLMLKPDIDVFLDTNISATTTNNEILNSLNTLLNSLENLNLNAECEHSDLKRRMNKHAPEVFKKFSKKNDLSKIQELGQIMATSEKEKWSKNHYVEAIEGSNLDRRSKEFLISKVGQPIIDFDTPLNQGRNTSRVPREINGSNSEIRRSRSSSPGSLSY
ncbi:hypothetical protein [Ascidiimonas sp. W6]|uniref:hypothetical protein n=1 Tax=Ascidiimonas meishanensis TaxID=3128903 RepID=UPI0030EF34C7